jgi:transcriptional regulator with XRE-family HTH domain
MYASVWSAKPAFMEPSPAMARRAAPPVPTHHNAIAHRLKLTYQASGERSKAAFCRRVGISSQAWNNYESGINRISIDQALKLTSALGVSLDWIYRGRTFGLPVEFYNRLDPLLSAGDRIAAS